MDVTNRVVEHIITKDHSNQVPLVKTLFALVRLREQEIREQSKVHTLKKMWARTYGVDKGLPCKGHILRLHVVRAVQVATSIQLSLTVDGLVPSSSFENWERNPVYEEWLLGLVCLDLKDHLLSWVKETSAYVACRAFRQEETNLVSLTKELHDCQGLVSERPGILGPSAIRKACKFLMAPRQGNSGFVKRVYRLAENVLYLKRSCPPMLEHCVLKQLKGHEARVCRATTEVGWQPRDQRIRLLTKEAIYAICHWVFEGKTFSPTETFPSSSASYETTRRHGGALAELAMRVNEPDVCSASLGLPMLQSMREVAPGQVLESFESPRKMELLRQFTKRVSQDVRPRVGNRIVAKPSPICEPCKVRVITIAEAAPYQRVAAVQKWLWREITKFPTFKYVGKPIDADWDEVFNPLSQFALGRLTHSSFVSGDFSAATDNLDPELSSYAWSCISKLTWLEDEDGRKPLHLSPWRKLVKRALVGHLLDYSATTGGLVAQTWGQLMGSPVSFPILNIVNAATTAVALHIGDLGLHENVCAVEHVRCHGTLGPEDRLFTSRDVIETLKHYRVRTNGDDLFFLCPDETYGIWKDVVTNAGLVPSLGKNYLSKEFAVMNSEMRVLVRAEGPKNRDDFFEPQAWQFENFANLPLIMGMEAKGLDAGKSVLDKLCWWEMSAREHQLLRGLDRRDSRYEGRVREFERWHKDVIKRVPPGVDYYVPIELGGAGLCFSVVREVKSDVGRRAAWLACLDPLKRYKATAFPAVPPQSTLESVVKEATKPLLRVTRRRTPEQVTRGSRSYGSATFANFLDAWSLYQLYKDYKYRCMSQMETGELTEEQFRCETAAFRRSLGIPPKRKVDISEPAAIRAWREGRALQALTYQQRKAQKARNIEPMKVESILCWTAPYYVEEDEYSSLYRSTVTL